jgi:hypothetical protein
MKQIAGHFLPEGQHGWDEPGAVDTCGSYNFETYGSLVEKIEGNLKPVAQKSASSTYQARRRTLDARP